MVGSVATGANRVGSVTVVPDSLTLRLSDTGEDLSAIARDTSGSPIGAATFRWLSENPAVVQVDASTGLLTPVSVGETRVLAIYAGVSGASTVRVVHGIWDIQLQVVAGNATSLGDTLRVVGRPVDRDGQVIPNLPLTWTSQDPAVVSFLTTRGDTALFRATGVGSTTVTAKAFEVQNSVTLSVQQVSAGAAVFPRQVQLYPGIQQTFTVSMLDAHGNPIPGTPQAR